MIIISMHINPHHLHLTEKGSSLSILHQHPTTPTPTGFLPTQPSTQTLLPLLLPLHTRHITITIFIASPASPSSSAASSSPSFASSRPPLHQSRILLFLLLLLLFCFMVGLLLNMKYLSYYCNLNFNMSE